jgi:hypothetical protein
MRGSATQAHCRAALGLDGRGRPSLHGHRLYGRLIGGSDAMVDVLGDVVDYCMT